MPRVLRRPMFRIGGTAEGITSGLSRQGYERGRVVNPGGYRGVPEVSHRGMPTFDNSRAESPTASVTGGGASQLDILGKMKRDLPGILEMSKALQYKPRGTNVYDFMTEFGLDLASRPKSGSIFQQIAASAKDPYAKYMERKKEAAEQEYGSESDMFKTMLGVYGDIAGGEGAGESARLLDKENTAIMIEDFIRNIDKNEKLLQDPNLTEDKKKELELQLRIDRTNLRNIKKKNIYAEAILKSDNYVKGFVNTIMESMVNEKLPNGKRRYPRGEDDPNLYPDAFAKFMSYFEETMATGGRVGYQNAGAVMPTAGPVTGSPSIMDRATTDTEVEDAYGVPVSEAVPATAGPITGSPSIMDRATTDTEVEDAYGVPVSEAVPEELQNIDYDTLRARLPSTITDDIVRLIANSAEAMEDFAMIQTQQDINNFNKKYGVELVLPAGA